MWTSQARNIMMGFHSQPFTNTARHRSPLYLLILGIIGDGRAVRSVRISTYLNTTANMTGAIRTHGCY